MKYAVVGSPLEHSTTAINSPAAGLHLNSIPLQPHNNSLSPYGNKAHEQQQQRPRSRSQPRVPFAVLPQAVNVEHSQPSAQMYRGVPTGRSTPVTPGTGRSPASFADFGAHHGTYHVVNGNGSGRSVTPGRFPDQQNGGGQGEWYSPQGQRHLHATTPKHGAQHVLMQSGTPTPPQFGRASGGVGSAGVSPGAGGGNGNIVERWVVNEDGGMALVRRFVEGPTNGASPLGGVAPSHLPPAMSQQQQSPPQYVYSPARVNHVPIQSGDGVGSIRRRSLGYLQPMNQSFFAGQPQAGTPHSPRTAGPPLQRQQSAGGGVLYTRAVPLNLSAGGSQTVTQAQIAGAAGQSSPSLVKSASASSSPVASPLPSAAVAIAPQPNGSSNSLSPTTANSSSAGQHPASPRTPRSSTVERNGSMFSPSTTATSASEVISHNHPSNLNVTPGGIPASQSQPSPQFYANILADGVDDDPASPTSIVSEGVSLLAPPEGDGPISVSMAVAMRSSNGGVSNASHLSQGGGPDALMYLSFSGSEGVGGLGQSITTNATIEGLTSSLRRTRTPSPDPIVAQLAIESPAVSSFMSATMGLQEVSSARDAAYAESRAGTVTRTSLGGRTYSSSPYPGHVHSATPTYLQPATFEGLSAFSPHEVNSLPLSGSSRMSPLPPHSLSHSHNTQSRIQRVPSSGFMHQIASSDPDLAYLDADAMRCGMSPAELQRHVRNIEMKIGNKRYNDGNPIAEVLEDLYLGDQGHASDVMMLQKRGIASIVNCAPDAVHTGPLFYQDALRGIHASMPWMPLIGMAYSAVAAKDECGYHVLQHLSDVAEFLNDARRVRGQKALIHCQAGINRSATLLVGYLMLEERMPLHAAIVHVFRRRPKILSRRGYIGELVILAHKLKLLDA